MAGVFLVVLAVVLSVSVLWPQPGYIHPDEFFQSTEVVAGKTVAWEWGEGECVYVVGGFLDSFGA